MIDLPLRIGTRGSPLALTQARMVADALGRAHGWPADALALVPIRTSGDRIQDRPLAEAGGKALWTRELDRALLGGAIDVAVHSLKDVETIRPLGIAIAAILPRADVRDRLIGADRLALLPPAPRVGTSSPRRAAQVRRERPDARIVPFRGNVDTRLAKLAAGEAEATLLAAAGLDRLGREAGVPVPVSTMLPAPSQGAIGIEALRRRGDLLHLLSAIEDVDSGIAVRGERALLAVLGGDCRSAVAALAEREEGGFRLTAELLLPDGSECVAGDIRSSGGSLDEAAAELAHRLLDRASPALRTLFSA